VPCVARRLVFWCTRTSGIELSWRWAIVTSAGRSGDDWRYIRRKQGHRLKGREKVFVIAVVVSVQLCVVSVVGRYEYECV
jgi:hypothetical protein